VNNSSFWPLMQNNVEKEDLIALMNYLDQEDPRLTHGPKVLEFERTWSNWLGVNHSVMVNSGSSANDLTMLAIKELYGGGEIIVPALTWVSDIASVLHAKFDPVFVDIDPHTLGIDTTEVLRAITSRTRAVFLTHVLGYNALTDRLLLELQEREILLIEDVCESHGACHNGQKLGSFGFASNFSFYYAHHMTTIEGGMVCTNDEEFYEVIRMLRSHGMVREIRNDDVREKWKLKYPDLNQDFIFAYPAHNMRPTELNGVLGISQLNRLDSNNERRSFNLSRFLEHLDPRLYKTDFRVEGSSNYAFTLVLKHPSMEMRNKVEEILLQNKVEFRRGLSGGGNQLRQPYIKRLGKFPEPTSLTNTDYVHHFGWYIGNHPGLPEEKIYWLCKILNNVSSPYV